jgi:hypothetical protein
MHGSYLISLVSWGENSRKKITIGFEMPQPDMTLWQILLISMCAKFQFITPQLSARSEP